MLPNYDQVRNIHYACFFSFTLTIMVTFIRRTLLPNAKHIEQRPNPRTDHFMNKIEY